MSFGEPPNFPSAYGPEPMSSHIVASSQLETPSHPELEGQRVFLSGVGDGVGEMVAAAFARQRTRLVLHSAQPAGRAAELADSLKPQAGAVRLFAAEIGADPAASERLARAALGAFGGVDLSINLIGGQLPVAGAQTARELDDLVARELRPALTLSRAIADHARNSGQAAAIIHVGLARSGQGAQFAHYGVLKSAIEGLTQDQARRWVSHDICVYAFVPGIDGEPFEEPFEANNVVSARPNFESALCAMLLNAAGGRMRWLNGVTVAVPA